MAFQPKAGKHGSNKGPCEGAPMTLLPARRKPNKMGLRKPPQVRSQAHLKWIRGHGCAVPDCQGFPIEAAHVRSGTDGGIAVKPSDKWCIPLCSVHHRQQHAIGEETFELIHKIDMKDIARRLYLKSPHRRKMEQERDG